MTIKSTSGIARLTLCTTFCAVLAACGGGGGSSTSTTSSSTSSTAAATSISGTVAIGTALVGANVTVTDSTGKTATATSGSGGAYSASISGLTAPFLITAVDPSGASTTLYSVVASTNTTGGAPVTANVTPLTTAVSALLTQSGNPGDLASSPSSITSSTIATAEATLDQAIAPILSANSVATSFDPIATTFVANQTGADAVIDSVTVTPSSTGSGYQIASLANSGTAIQLNTSTSVSTALAAPSQPANYLATLLTQLGQCMGGTSSSCSTAIDSNYLNYSDPTMQKRHPALFATGATLTGVKTLAFLPANTLPNVTNPAALVYFLFTEANGTPNFATDIVQQLPNGSWDIIGDQDAYPLYAASFVGRLQYVDSADSANSRYESGLRVLIPSSVTISGSTTYVSSALVTGPGLPAGGVYLESGGSANPYLTFPLTALTGPTTDNPSTAIANGTSSEYKMTWASISGSSVSVPSTSDYPPQQVNLSTVQQFGTYTITLYRQNGDQIGTPQTVINVAPLYNAQTGTEVAWQTLGSDVISNFLTPGGSEAGSGVTSLALDWTESATNPLTPSAILTGELLPNTGGAWGGFVYQTSPTVTQSGTTYTATVSTVTWQTLPADTNRSVVLSEQENGDYYLNTWQYNN